ncbi:MAG: hypothetical protein ACI4VP_01080 [Clostridia bacterium]
MIRVKKIIKYLKMKINLKKTKNTIINSMDICNDINIGENCVIAKTVRIGTNVKIGKCTYISPRSTVDSNVIIGSYCSIAPNVFIAPGQHKISNVTTHPILFDPIWRKKLNIPEKEYYQKEIGKQEKETIIGNDVWIRIKCNYYERNNNRKWSYNWSRSYSY